MLNKSTGRNTRKVKKMYYIIQYDKNNKPIQIHGSDSRIISIGDARAMEKWLEQVDSAFNKTYTYKIFKEVK